MSAREIGYVVVCFNQASGHPEVEDGSFSTYQDDARDYANQERERTRSVGRGERYAVALVVLDEESS